MYINDGIDPFRGKGGLGYKPTKYYSGTSIITIKKIKKEKVKNKYL